MLTTIQPGEKTQLTNVLSTLKRYVDPHKRAKIMAILRSKISSKQLSGGHTCSWWCLQRAVLSSFFGPKAAIILARLWGINTPFEGRKNTSKLFTSSQLVLSWLTNDNSWKIAFFHFFSRDPGSRDPDSD